MISINEFGPTIRGTIPDLVGYIYENSNRNTIVTDPLGITQLRLIASDPDQVNPFYY